jgi:hypothetical protein
MGAFADDLRAGIDEATRRLAEARLAGDDHGADAYGERLSYLRRVVRRHGVEFPLRPAPAARDEACAATGRRADERPGAGRPPGGTAGGRLRG